MRFFYQSGAMGFSGKGWWWHKAFGYKFPKLPTITKTITYYPKKGRMFPVVPIPFTDSVWNRIGLSNPGLVRWIQKTYNSNLILSLYINNYEELVRATFLLKNYKLRGIELNISCPNVDHNEFFDVSHDECIEMIRNQTNIQELHLKVRYDQDLNKIENLHLIDRINLNSVPYFFGAISGKKAQEKNWGFIKKWQGMKGVPTISGCSWNHRYDLYKLKEMGCEYFGIGTVMITNPRFIEQIHTKII